jgi:hypothetical protein
MLVLLGLGFSLLPVYSKAGPGAYRTQCLNQARNIGLALLNYHAEFGTFPPAYVADDAGRPMHSWRVLILPYLDGKDLYQRYRFDEPWDGPHNTLLHTELPAFGIFHCHEDPSDQTHTSYLAVLGQNTAWPGTSSTRQDKDFPDRLGQTLLVVESSESGIHWMEPRDLEFDTLDFRVNGPRSQSVRGNHPRTLGWTLDRARCATVVSVDGRVRSVSDETSPEELRAMLTRNANENEAPSR